MALQLQQRLPSSPPRRSDYYHYGALEQTHHIRSVSDGPWGRAGVRSTRVWPQSRLGTVKICHRTTAGGALSSDVTVACFGKRVSLDPCGTTSLASGLCLIVHDECAFHVSGRRGFQDNARRGHCAYGGMSAEPATVARPAAMLLQEYVCQPRVLNPRAGLGGNGNSRASIRMREGRRLLLGRTADE